MIHLVEIDGLRIQHFRSIGTQSTFWCFKVEFEDLFSYNFICWIKLMTITDRLVEMKLTHLYANKHNEVRKYPVIPTENISFRRIKCLGKIRGTESLVQRILDQND
jgi:hypothetical protein